MNTVLKGFLCLLMLAITMLVLDNSETWLTIIGSVEDFEDNVLYDIFDRFNEIRERIAK